MGWLDPRPQEDIAHDPALIYQVGQLMGMARLAGKLLTEQENPDIKVIGEDLLAQVSWFYLPDKNGKKPELPPVRK